LAKRLRSKSFELFPHDDGKPPPRSRCPKHRLTERFSRWGSSEPDSIPSPSHNPVSGPNSTDHRRLLPLPPAHFDRHAALGMVPPCKRNASPRLETRHVHRPLRRRPPGGALVHRNRAGLRVLTVAPGSLGFGPPSLTKADRTRGATVSFHGKMPATIPRVFTTKSRSTCALFGNQPSMP